MKRISREIVDDGVHVPLTAAQLRRIQQLQQAALQAAATRDAVLSAIIESVIDQDLTGWKIDFREHELVLTPPAVNAMSNGQPDSQAAVMTP